MFLFTVRTYIRSLEENGYFLPLAFARKISQDAIILTLSDATLVITTGLCVPYALAIRNGWIRYYWLGVVIQHTFQAAVLAIAVLWTFNRLEMCFLVLLLGYS
jgi:sterol O-acyltransferase